MTQVYLYQLASQRTQWLSARQQLIAGNVANSTTPGYRAQDLKPFAAVLDHTSITMATTNPLHMAPEPTEIDPAKQTDADAADPTISGNTVSLQDEMIKLGEVSRESQTTNAVKKIFHQMMMSALK